MREHLLRPDGSRTNDGTIVFPSFSTSIEETCYKSCVLKTIQKSNQKKPFFFLYFDKLVKELLQKFLLEKNKKTKKKKNNI